jgi:chemotaxis methyl-accepting protein methylase
MTRSAPLSQQPRRRAQYLEHVVFPRLSKRRRVFNLAETIEARAAHALPNNRLPVAIAEFLDWLFARTGLAAKAYRAETLERRLPACLRALRAESIAQAREIIIAQPDLAQTAVSALLVGVTSFFRDPIVFEQLRYQALAELAAGRNGLYVWSAGCSEGAELRSLAILLDELNLLGRSYLLGTDCRPEAITAARAGVYHTASLSAVSARRRERYFVQHAEKFRFHLPQATLRWRVASILDGPQPGFWDVILFRNTAMYLQPDVNQRLWPQLEEALRPGGLLILGKAERPVGAQRLTPIGPSIYQRLRR